MIDIVTKDLCVSLPWKRIVDCASIHVDQGEFVGLLGPNGSGKSTMLKTIYRTMKKESGDISMGGRSLDEIPLKESALLTSVVTQHNYFNFDFKVEEVVMMGRTPPQEGPGDGQQRRQGDSPECTGEGEHVRHEGQELHVLIRRGASEDHTRKGIGTADPLSHPGRSYEPSRCEITAGGPGHR